VAALLASDLVVHAGEPPVDVVARPARVTRVRGGRDLGSVLAGRARPASGRLLVAGLLLPEQRESVNQVATMVEVAAPPPPDVDGLVGARARLVSFSPRKRREYAARVTSLVDELSAAAGGSLHAAVLEAALAVASHTEVIVLVGVDELTSDDRAALGTLADELARRGLAVLIVGGQEATQDAGPVLVESGAGAAHE
jgi:hypothetical protein